MGAGQPVADNSAASLAIERPIRSAVEDDSAQPSVNFFTYLEVYATVRSTARQLKTRKLKEVLDELVVYRQTRTAKYAGCTIETMEQRILKAASAFRRARRYVPVEPSCLLDSLSMTRFLSRRGPHASIVFGVTLDPFSAHCWVQAEGMTLNETIGQANAHTPILVL
ncbi:lasso peptide biosynthesis B2 protein [Xanthomonas hortorum]|uniref:lasso peptide biosynthesis B2 protein n=1 Tax=Xanthomonas hortorum TaxID=56454 RepID=UPI0032E8D141